MRKLAPTLEALGAGVYAGISGRTLDWAALPIPVSDDRYGPAMAEKSAVLLDTGNRDVSVARCWRGLGCLGGPMSVTVWGFGLRGSKYRWSNRCWWVNGLLNVRHLNR